MSEGLYDLAIIGGGVNGAGLARDSAGRGARVILFEQGDLAEHTSSRSSKLVHGGLRYLEHYAFRLVREALKERETLWSIAPHIVRPLRFVLPHHRGLRPRWMLRAGLFLYDHIGGRRRLPGARAIALQGGPLQGRYTNGFEYSDCWVDDARLVILNARDAAARGAEICPRERVIAARREGPVWRVETERRVIAARALANAAGPWVRQIAAMAGAAHDAPVRLVRGSHIVVPRLFADERAYILQNADGRMIFVLPYEDDFTLIGTTDGDYSGDPAAVCATDDEIAYLCAAAGAYLRAPLAPAQIVWSYSGVRALYDDGAGAAKDATRDYVLTLDKTGAPIVSVYGGKITTYRRLAERALSLLAPTLPVLGAPSWTGAAALPGGAFMPADLPAMLDDLRARAPALTEQQARRLLRAYGTEAAAIAAAPGAGAFGADLGQGEVDHLRTLEWARTAQDILWRRTKLGLRLRPAEVMALEGYLRR